MALGCGAVPTIGEPITTVLLIFSLRVVYGGYLVRQLSIEDPDRGQLEIDGAAMDADGKGETLSFSDDTDPHVVENQVFTVRPDSQNILPDSVLWEEPDFHVPIVQVIPVTSRTREHLSFLDNLRVALVLLLILAHVASAFGANDMFYFTLGS
jgi:hypothetical protein